MRNKKSEVKKKGFKMAPGAFLRWLSFVLYIGLCFTLPLTLLIGTWGLVPGTAFTLLFLFQIRFRGTQRIFSRLKLRRLPRAEAPQVHAAVEEYCRRLSLPVPKIGLMNENALNLTIFGWSRDNLHLVFTQGIIDRLSREQLNALIGRELCDAWTGEVPCETWLSQFLSVFTSWVVSSLPSQSPNRRVYTLKLFSKQAVLFPLTLFPAFILKGRRNERAIDVLAVKLTRRANALAEAMRKLEALQERLPLTVALSDSHLFLLPPRNQDPLTRVFFTAEKLGPRVRSLELLRKVVTP